MALLPLLAVVGLACAQLLMAGAAREFAGNAAEAAAVAMLQGGDPQDAARAAVPGWARSKIAVDVKGGTVRVQVDPAPLVPPLADLLTAQAVAHSGAR
ncbi:MAG: hypothetical protein ACJ762_03330 [Solirubrobacteraceae bacterium]